MFRVSAAALSLGVKCIELVRLLSAATLLALAILSLHFIAMGAVTVVPDPTRLTALLSLSPTEITALIAAAAISVLGICLLGVIFQQQSEIKVQWQKTKLDTAIQNISQGLAMFDSEGRITLFNDRYLALVGLPREFVRGRTLLEIFRRRIELGDATEAPEEFFASILAEVKEGEITNRIIEQFNGRTLRIIQKPMAGGGWVATLEDITDAKKAQAKIWHLAHHDSLTDLPNRVQFRDQLENDLHRIRRTGQLSVMCLDLDHFKEINDTLGHPAGDALLNNVAHRLKDCVRDLDTVARLGGDEFAIIQVGVQNQTVDAAALASRIVDALGKPFDLNGHQVTIGASVGVSVSPGDGSDVDVLVKKADLALYRAKDEGRNTFRFFEPDMDAKALARRLLECELRAALANSEFEAYYQPIHNLTDDKIVGFEALLRWNHPTRGLVSPLEFIPLAEESGLIIPIGEWVLREACREAACWSTPLRVAVNLSPVQFKGKNVVRVVQAALADSGLAANRLELEITESAFLQDNDDTLSTLHTLREIGVRISMDDFGTGYSSLSYLRSFPFDKIKIDRSFVHNSAQSEESRAIIRAVAGLGKSLRMTTTAEGVETFDEMAFLLAEGCTEIQGYFISPPVPSSQIDEMLTKRDGLCAAA